MRILALVMAAGRGLRAGDALPKQYRSVLGIPLLRHTLKALARCSEISAIRVVIHGDDRALYEAAVMGLGLMPPVTGGASRQESVRLGLESVADDDFDAVLIHDAARPFVSPALIHRVIAALTPDCGAIPALAISDSLKQAEGGRIVQDVPRGGLWRAQTPQAFPFAAILTAHRRFQGQDMTDDAAVARAADIEVTIVPGEEENFKVTEAPDFLRAEERILMRLGDIRTGSGFDVHRFGPTDLRSRDHVTLCGLAIPYSQGLIGHSDADVALHALTDAILGAIGAGDIGQHFPPSDPKWKGADSGQFLRHAASLVKDLGGVIAHADVTIICEAPKITPHRAAMVARLAELLGLEPGRVSVKATTTEQLGFTGRREGIAAQAIATVRLPLLSANGASHD